MNRHYYVSDNLQDLVSVERELENAGLEHAQIHVYSKAFAASGGNHEIADFHKSDVVHSGLTGFGIGLLAALAVLLAAQMFGWTNSSIGWTPFIFLAVVVFGFCAWEGGLRGIQTTNRELTRFANALKHGKHIFFVDVDDHQEGVVSEIIERHPQMRYAGDGAAAPGWLVHGQTQFQRLVKALP